MPRPRLMTVDDLSALSDTQLGEFMEKHRRPDGSFELPIDDWNRLSEGERDRLAERLQSIQRASANNPIANSRPLDLNKLDALLRDASSRGNSMSPDRPHARERQTESPEDPREVYRERETEAYNNLVNDGSRLLYPIGLMDLVSKDPDAYYEMLQPFWRQPRGNKPSEMDHFDARAVFRRQWHRWQNFRKWQLHNRGNNNEDEDDGFLAYAEKMKRNYIEVGWADSAAEIEADPTILKQPGQGWYYIQRHRNWQRRCQREPGCKSFFDYEKAVKVRLTRHGFTRPFHLAEDPKQQDELTTWIEYLDFEYWWLDRYIASTERLKLKHDESWEELKKAGVVKDDETPEFVRTDASGTRCQREEDHARQAVQDAESEAEKIYQKTQKDPDRLSIPKERRVQMLVKVRQRLLAAREVLDFTKRRSDLLIDFVRGTFNYVNAKEDVVNQTILSEWVAGQALKIEAEQKAVRLDGSSQKKREATSEDVCPVQSDAKRHKSNAQKHNSQPSNDESGTGDRRVLHRRNHPSADINRQLNRDQSHNIHDTYISQTILQGWAEEPLPLTEAESELVTSKGSLRKRGNVAFEDTSLMQSSPKRLKPSAQGNGSQGSNIGVGATDRRVLRMRNRRTGVSQHLCQYQTQGVQATNFSSQSAGSDVPSQELTQGLRRSSRLAALRPGPEIHLARRKTNITDNLGSEYLPVEKILEKRIRRRGRGCITEYLVRFKGYDSLRNLWTNAQELPKNATDSFDQFVS